MLLNYTKNLLFKDLFLTLFFSLIFSFFFMEILKNKKNLSYYKYDLIISNNLDELLDKIKTNDTVANKEKILSRLYIGIIAEIKENQNISVFERSNFNDLLKQNEIVIPIRELIKKKNIVKKYLTNNPGKINCKKNFKNYTSIAYKNCEITDDLITLFDNEKKYENFYQNNLKFLKRKEIFNNNYFFKFNFFFIFFYIIIITLKCKNKKY